MNPAIFRPNDLRGIIDKDFTVEDFSLIGQGYAKFLLDRGANKTVIGRDNRLHSAKLQDSFVSGLLSSGIDVIDLGEVTTPMVYFARINLNVEGGVCITASHNPPEWNGAKLCFGNGAIHEQEITEVSNNTLLKRFEKGQGKLTKHDITPAYLNEIRTTCNFEFIKANLPFKKIGIDSGNGMAGRFVPVLLKELGLEVYDLYSIPDGTYPNHLPNPGLGENMTDLWNLCGEKQLDLGIAFDGDVDRLNVIDNKQVILWGDGLTIFFARDLLKRMPRGEILYDVMSSPAVPEDISNNGGISIVVPSGHSMIAHRLHRLHAPMAGEYSGHIYFADGYLGFDDAIYAAFRLIKILAVNKQALDQAMTGVPYYLSSGITDITVSEEKKDAIITSLLANLQDKYYADRIGGIRSKVNDCWVTIHPSGTESLIRVVVWGKSTDEIEKTKQLILDEIKKIT